MKTNSMLRRILSTVAAAAIIAGSLVSVQAATIPFEENFNDRTVGAKLIKDSNRYEPDTNGFGLIYSCSGGYLEIVNDLNEPEHGNVLKHKLTSDATAGEIFGWTFTNSLDSEYILVQFDVKAKRNSRLVLSTGTPANWSLWNPVLEMKDGHIYPDKDTTKEPIEYALNTWYRISTIIDMTNKKAANYVSDESGNLLGSGEYSFLSNEMDKFGALTLNATQYTETADEDGMYFDNVVIKELESIETTAYLYDKNNEAGDIVSLTNTLTLKTDDGFMGAINGIMLTDLGTDVLTQTESEPVSVTSRFNNGEVNLYFTNKLLDGHKYRITLPENTKTAFGRIITNTSFEFIAMENAGKKTKSYQTDFSDFENDAEGNAVLPTGLEVISSGTGGSVEVVEDASLSGGKGLKVTGNKSLLVQLTDGFIRGGSLKINGNIKHGENKRFEILMAQAAKNPTHYLMRSIAGNLYHFFQGNTDVASTASPLTDTDVFDFEAEYDFDNATVKSYNYNDQYTADSATGSWAKFPAVSASLGNILDNNHSFRYITLSPSANTANPNSSIIIDSFGFEYSYNTPMVKDAYFTVGEEQVRLKAGEKLPTEATALTLVFATKMRNRGDSTSLSDSTVMLRTGDESVSYTGNLAEDEKTYTMTFNEPLGVSKQYRLVTLYTLEDTCGTKFAADTKILGYFNTEDGSFGVSDLAIKNSDGTEISDVTAVVTAMPQISVNNTTAETQKLSLIFATYKGNKLVQVSYEDISVAPGESGVKTFENGVTITDSDITKIKVFAVNNMEDLTPIIPAVEK